MRLILYAASHKRGLCCVESRYCPARDNHKEHWEEWVERWIALIIMHSLRGKFYHRDSSRSSLDNHSYTNREGHKDKCGSHKGIDLSYYLIYRKQSGNYVVEEYYAKPYMYAPSCKISHKAGRA